jgi:hypothetical protein
MTAAHVVDIHKRLLLQQDLATEHMGAFQPYLPTP